MHTLLLSGIFAVSANAHNTNLSAFAKSNTSVILECEAVANLQVAIGTPANGASNTLQVSWNAAVTATSYELEYSTNGTAFTGTTEVTGTSYTFNAGNNPDKAYWFRVRIKNIAGDCSWTTTATPRYTAANVPGQLVIASTTTSLSFTISAESPAANPAITTYSIFSPTNAMYVQQNGTFGATETFLTKTAWNSVTLSNLPSQTEYCFYTKAKNQDGDIRFAAPNAILSTQEFNTNILTQGTSTSTWYAPNSNPPIVWSATGGCTGGKIGYSGNFNGFWGNFIRLPRQDASYSDKIVLKLNLSNSYVASAPNSFFRFYIWADNGYKQVVSEVKINGTPITTDNYGKILFNQLRNCVPVEITFNLATISNRSDILIYLDVNSAYNNSSEFSFSFDNVGVIESTPPAVCATTILGLDNHSAASIGIYPNPAQSKLTIQTNETIRKTEVFSMLGQLIKAETSGSEAINVSGLPNGAYLLQVTLANGAVVTEKFIKN